MGTKEKNRELELLILDNGASKSSLPVSSSSSLPISSSSSSSSPPSGREAFYMVFRSWASKKFMSGCVILLPIAITFYTTWWFIHFVDGFFSPVYMHLGIHMFGLGFVTSITFIFLVGVFMSSWLGASVLGLGEWFIKKMPLMSYIYSASKQISAAISPDQSSHAFKEVAIIRHPRIGEYAFGFITSTVILQKPSGAEELCCVYVPTNHLYLGDILLISSKDILRPNLSVREGIGNFVVVPLPPDFMVWIEIPTFSFGDTSNEPTWKITSINCYIWRNVNSSDFDYNRSSFHSFTKSWKICYPSGLKVLF